MSSSPPMSMPSPAVWASPSKTNRLLPETEGSRVESATKGPATGR